MTTTISREMTITHDDFFRLLPKALRYHDYTVNGEEVHVQDENFAMTISLSMETRRKLGSFSLPVTHIKMQFEDIEEQSIQQFLTVFDRAYQKGGG